MHKKRPRSVRMDKETRSLVVNCARFRRQVGLLERAASTRETGFSVDKAAVMQGLAVLKAAAATWAFQLKEGGYTVAAFASADAAWHAGESELSALSDQLPLDLAAGLRALRLQAMGSL